MRCLPKSLTGRVLAVLFVGLLFIVVDISFALSYLYSDRQERNIHASIKIASIVELYNASPAENRHNLFVGQEDFRLLANQPQLSKHDDWHLNILKYHFSHKIDMLGIQDVLIGKNQQGQIVAAINTQDKQWIEFKVHDNTNWRTNLAAGLTVIIIFFTGLLIIAIIITRYITRPMKRLAYAANLFGTDMDAPPIEESGPVEVNHAAVAFNKMQERIRRFVQERTQMLAAISHDLRTPLTRLRLRAEYIQDSQQQEKAVQDIEEMQAMIETSLQFARQNSDQEAKGLVDVHELIELLVSQYHDMQQEIDYSGSDRILLNARPLALKRCLSNLLDNALRFGKQASIEAKQKDDKVEILIKDDGPGIPEAERQKVFSPFYRLEPSRNRNTGGTGLGLAVAQGIVHGHGGTIEILDNPPQGTTVKISLPSSLNE